MALNDNPIKGPFPDGDSRNITLTQSKNAFEPERTGPQEPTYRGNDAPQSVIGSLESSELKSGADAPPVNTNPDFVQIGKDGFGETMAALTPGSDTTSAMGGLLRKIGDAYGLGDDDGAETGTAKGVQSAPEASETSEASEARQDEEKRAARYTLNETCEPSASQTAFGLPGGGLPEPVLEEDWNPAERNSDDLSR